VDDHDDDDDYDVDDDKPQRLKQSPHVVLTHCFDKTTTNLWPDDARGRKQYLNYDAANR